MRHIWPLLLAACTSLLGDGPLPDFAVVQAAQKLTEVAHPTSTFEGAEVVGHRDGPGRDDRWIDVDARYSRKDERHVMRVRFVVRDLDPCNIKVDVVDDTGPKPVRVDNALVKGIVGRKMCRALADWWLATR